MKQSQTKELYQQIFDIEEKDESYLYYQALNMFKPEMEVEKSLLEDRKKNGKLTEKESQKLNKLYEQFYYIEKTNDKAIKRKNDTDIKLKIEKERYQSNSELNRLKNENKKLQSEIKMYDEAEIKEFIKNWKLRKEVYNGLEELKLNKTKLIKYQESKSDNQC